MCDSIYIGNPQQTFKNRMYSHFSYDQRYFKNRQKSDLFSAHHEQHFKSIMSCTELCKCMELKAVKYLNPIEAMKSFTELYFNLCIKNIRDKKDTLMNKN